MVADGLALAAFRISRAKAAAGVTIGTASATAPLMNVEDPAKPPLIRGVRH